MLKTMQNLTYYDIRLVSVSPSYVKIDQRVSLDPSSTVYNLIVSKFPWIHPDDPDFTLGFGTCTNNEPESMTWNRAKVLLNTNICDLWPITTLSPTQEFLIVCCLFSRKEYCRQKDRLETVLGEMAKWIPPRDSNVYIYNRV
jgi:hypothetical protein